MRLLGVSHLTTVGEELGDGTEICGRFFHAPAVWERVSEMVPPPDQFKAVRWEQGRNIPLGALHSPEQVAQLKRAWGDALWSTAAVLLFLATLATINRCLGRIDRRGRSSCRPAFPDPTAQREINNGAAGVRL